MFRTITAKYNGTCKRCTGQIIAGQKIRYGGYGRTYHLKADCAQIDPQYLDAAGHPLDSIDDEQPIRIEPPAETVIELEF